MKKPFIRRLLCVVMLFAAVALTACSGETEALQARIDSLEAENVGLQSTISSLSADLERAQTDLLGAQSELHYLQSALAAAQEEDEQETGDEQGATEGQAAGSNQVGPLAITYGGVANEDMSWPLDFGELILGLRIDFSELGEENEIVWRSTNEDIFTVESKENGTSATVTPVAAGAAQLVVTVGDQETRSWVRIS